MTVLSVTPAPNRAGTYNVRRGFTPIGWVVHTTTGWAVIHTDGEQSTHPPFDTAEDAAKYLNRNTHHYEGITA